MNNDFYLNIGDKITNTEYRPLMTITSQVTGKSKTFITNVDVWANKARYVRMGMFLTRSSSLEILGSSIVQVGTIDFPLGFYDAIIYQNSGETNLDPTGLPVLFNGLANLIIPDGDTQPVSYTQYTDNDSETESIYITNPAQ